MNHGIIAYVKPVELATFADRFPAINTLWIDEWRCLWFWTLWVMHDRWVRCKLDRPMD